jgi:hypothetical protein
MDIENKEEIVTKPTGKKVVATTLAPKKAKKVKKPKAPETAMDIEIVAESNGDEEAATIAAPKKAKKVKKPKAPETAMAVENTEATVAEPTGDEEAATTPAPEKGKKIKGQKGAKGPKGPKEDYRITLLTKITKGLKKLKQHSLRKTIRLLQDAQNKKDDQLKKKCDKLHNKFTSLKKLSVPDLQLLALFLMEFEFEVSLKKVEKEVEAEVPGFRKNLTDLGLIVPKKYAKEEIDLAEGNNVVFVAILNFYEFMKTKQQGAFKELTDMIEDTKGKSNAKMMKNKDRRVLKKAHKKELRESGKFVSKEEYWKVKDARKAEKVALDVVKADEKAARLAIFHEKKEAERTRQDALKAAKDAKTGKGPRNWDPSLGKKNVNHGIRKDKDAVAPGIAPKPFDRKDYTQNSAVASKFDAKKNFNQGARDVNKAAAFSRPAAGARTLPPADGKNFHASWELKKQLREKESNIDLKKKNMCVEL